jgi:hypothetical protein
VGSDRSLTQRALNRVNFQKSFTRPSALSTLLFGPAHKPAQGSRDGKPARCAAQQPVEPNIRFTEIITMAKIAKTGDRAKVMDTQKSTDCPKCSKPTRIVKRVKDRERGIPGGVYISCSACEFFEKL